MSMRPLLDGSTLEFALTALDLLNACGKMIGIISHVDRNVRSAAASRAMQ